MSIPGISPAFSACGGIDIGPVDVLWLSWKYHHVPDRMRATSIPLTKAKIVLPFNPLLDSICLLLLFPPSPFSSPLRGEGWVRGAFALKLPLYPHCTLQFGLLLLKLCRCRVVLQLKIPQDTLAIDKI